MSVALRGNLQDFGIAEVFQLIGQQRKTGVLELVADKVSMQLAFDQGAVVWGAPAGGAEGGALGDMLLRCGLATRDVLRLATQEATNTARALSAVLSSKGFVSESDLAQVEDLLTGEVIFEVLRWSSGSFDFSAKAVKHSRDPERLFPAEQILMDGLRMLDEWRTFVAHVPTDDVVFGHKRSFEVFREKATGDLKRRLPQVERVFNLIDGRSPARRVIDLSRLGTFEGTRMLASLAEAEVIERVEGVRAMSIPRPAFSGSRLLDTLRATVGTVIPLALLVGCVWLAFSPPLWSQPNRPAEGFALPSSALSVARDEFATRRLRHALAANHFAGEPLPASLSAQRPVGWVDAEALAAVQGRPYYYLSRPEESLVLAPMNRLSGSDRKSDLTSDENSNGSRDPARANTRGQ